MTVAAVERVNLQGNAEAQAEQIRTVMALVFPEGPSRSCARRARGFSSARAPSPLRPSRRSSRSASRDARPAEITSLNERKAEDEDDGGEPDGRGERCDRDLLPDRVGGDHGSRGRCRRRP